MRVSALKVSWLFLVITMLFFGLLFGNVSAFAEACTYNEAIVALKQGNTLRGAALLKMAANDGDQRAIHLLAERNINTRLSMLMLDQGLSVSVTK